MRSLGAKESGFLPANFEKRCRCGGFRPSEPSDAAADEEQAEEQAQVTGPGSSTGRGRGGDVGQDSNPCALFSRTGCRSRALIRKQRVGGSSSCGIYLGFFVEDCKSFLPAGQEW